MHFILSGNSTFNTNRLREKSVYVQNFIGLYVRDNRSIPRRMLKKVVQQGRSERRGEEVQTALRVAVHT